MFRAVRSVMRKYARFRGRAGRREFWWWVFFYALVVLIASVVDGAVIRPALEFEPFAFDGGRPLSIMIVLVLILPNLALLSRRLHDTGRTARWMLIGLVPVIGALVLLIFAAQRGEAWPNDYGGPRT